jgi:hypothetical protein
MDREGLKDMLASLADKVVLDPANLECRIHRRIGIEGRNRVASPRGCHSIPVSLRPVVPIRVPVHALSFDSFRPELASLI